MSSSRRRVTKKRGVTGGLLPHDLTQAEAEVLHLLTVEFLTPAEISRRRHTKKPAVFNIISRLRKKGFLSMVSSTPVSSTYTNLTTTHKIRLHAERYRISLLRDSSEFHAARRRTNSILLDGNRVVLYRDSLMVYSEKSFFADDCDSCEAAAVVYWWRFFVKLENHLGISILKERSQNIKQTFYHFAELGNELADDLRRKKNKVRVFGSDDGKEWLLFDDSLRLSEAETTRPPSAVRNAKDDMSRVVRPFFNDLRDKEDMILLPSELSRSLSETAFFVRENAASLGLLIKLLSPPDVLKEVKGDDWRPDYVG